MADSTDEDAAEKLQETDENPPRKRATRRPARLNDEASSQESLHSSESETEATKGKYVRSKKRKAPRVELATLPAKATKGNVSKKQFNDLLAIASQLQEQVCTLQEEAAEFDNLLSDNKDLKASKKFADKEIKLKRDALRLAKEKNKSLQEQIAASGGGSTFQKFRDDLERKRSEAEIKFAKEELARKDLEVQKQVWIRREADLVGQIKKLEKDNQKLREKDIESRRAIEKEKTRRAAIEKKNKEEERMHKEDLVAKRTQASKEVYEAKKQVDQQAAFAAKEMRSKQVNAMQDYHRPPSSQVSALFVALLRASAIVALHLTHSFAVYEQWIIHAWLIWSSSRLPTAIWHAPRLDACGPWLSRWAAQWTWLSNARRTTVLPLRAAL